MWYVCVCSMYGIRMGIGIGDRDMGMYMVCI